MASNQCTPIHQPRQEPFQPGPLLISPTTFQNYSYCARAFSLFGMIPDQPGRHLFGVTCKTWSCRSCAASKCRTLSFRTKGAAPNRLLTLTIDPALYQNPRQAFESTASFVPELIRYLRTKFGEVEYLRVTEVTKNGWPHYHLLIRSGFLPHAVVKNKWNELTGAKIVDLRQVGESFGAYQYLLKYLTKLHKLEWTERHVSYSKSFFPPLETEQRAKCDLLDITREKIHPYVYLTRWYSGHNVTVLSGSHWLLTGPGRDDPLRVNPVDLGVADSDENKFLPTDTPYKKDHHEFAHRF